MPAAFHAKRTFFAVTSFKPVPPSRDSRPSGFRPEVRPNPRVHAGPRCLASALGDPRGTKVWYPLGTQLATWPKRKIPRLRGFSIAGRDSNPRPSGYGIGRIGRLVVDSCLPSATELAGVAPTFPQFGTRLVPAIWRGSACAPEPCRHDARELAPRALKSPREWAPAADGYDRGRAARPSRPRQRRRRIVWSSRREHRRPRTRRARSSRAGRRCRRHCR
jgi:hypothetical protein